MGLSQNQLGAIKQALDSNHVQVSQEDLKPLRDRDLIDDGGGLSNSGKVFALSLCPLEEQCLRLQIPLRELSIEGNQRLKRMELEVLDHFRSHGYDGCFNHGNVIPLLLWAPGFRRIHGLAEHRCDNVYPYTYIGDEEAIDAAMKTADSLFSKLAFDKVSPSDFRTVWDKHPDVTILTELQSRLRGGFTVYFDFVKDDPQIERRILEDILYAPREDILENFRVFCTPEYGIQEGHNGLTREVFASLFDRIGRRRLYDIGKIFVREPGAFGVGWPDLILVNDASVLFVEVKQKDRLRPSQIITITEIVQAVKLKMEVVRVKSRRAGLLNG